ncbi:MAG: hypothetical protein LBH46_02435 [Rickettsiales bacterium]|jgi:myo-inositol-1(or 4)-monophosphatase|nr:hypothetical protein [Rickettsiales bacterium]
MSIFSSDLFFIKNALTTPSKTPFLRGMDLANKIAKDYTEIENLQSSNKLNAFVQNLLLTIRTELLGYFTKRKYILEFEGKIVEDDDKKENKGLKVIINIDGKLNLYHSIPYFCIAIALESKGEIVGGVISNPITQEIFVVEKGRGTFVNERRVRVSKRENLDECIISNRNILTLSKVLDVCYVASGKYDGAIIKNAKVANKLSFLMVEEAGGIVEKKENKFCITNGLIKL